MRHSGKYLSLRVESYEVQDCLKIYNSTILKLQECDKFTVLRVLVFCFYHLDRDQKAATDLNIFYFSRRSSYSIQH